MAFVILVGSLCGTLISILTVLAEHSNVAYGSYALSGNGALIVPALLAPYAVFAGWTWALRRGGRALELALFIVGLHFGIGMIPVLEVLFFPAQPDLTVLDALPGLLLTGAIFVDPLGLLAAGALWWVRRANDRALPIALALALIATILLGFVYGIGLGVLAGAAVALVERRPERSTLIAVVLAVLMLVLGNLPILLAVFFG